MSTVVSLHLPQALESFDHSNKLILMIILGFIYYSLSLFEADLYTYLWLVTLSSNSSGELVLMSLLRPSLVKVKGEIFMGLVILVIRVYL